MADEVDVNSGDDEFSLDELPVRLSFDLGERGIALGELRTLMPGYTFQLGRDVRRAVIIRANGRAIGEGEVVDVDGRIGVAILRLSNAAG